MSLLQITLPYACFGIPAEAGRVVQAAPIARWMIGKHLIEVTRWLTNKLDTVTLID